MLTSSSYLHVCASLHRCLRCHDVHHHHHHHHHHDAVRTPSPSPCRQRSVRAKPGLSRVESGRTNQNLPPRPSRPSGKKKKKKKKKKIKTAKHMMDNV